MSIKVIHIEPEFIDERGFISRILDESRVSIKSILYIERKKGTVGGNHYHKKDSHFIYVLKGKLKYIEKNIDIPKSSIETAYLEPGDMVLTNPHIAHATEFVEDTVFLTFATQHRSQQEYEEDTVRVDFIGKKQI